MTDSFEEQSDKNDDVWDEQYQKLLAYKKEHGHCQVSRVHKDKNFASWVCAQRIEKTKGTISNEHLKQLNKIGFEWKIFATDWDRQYDKLLTYYKKHGNCYVPDDHQDAQLVRWLDKQRFLKSKGELSADYTRKLNELKFVWHVSDSIWKTQPEKLVWSPKANTTAADQIQIPSS